MSKYKSLLRREHIAAVAVMVAQGVEKNLVASGLRVRVKVNQSKRTGSVYVRIVVYSLAGQKMKDCGAVIRIADHSKPVDRWANFSRFAKRSYGVWAFSAPWKVTAKVNRIGRHVLETIEQKGGVQ